MKARTKPAKQPKQPKWLRDNERELRQEIELMKSAGYALVETLLRRSPILAAQPETLLPLPPGDYGEVRGQMHSLVCRFGTSRHAPADRAAVFAFALVVHHLIVLSAAVPTGPMLGGEVFLLGALVGNVQQALVVAAAMMRLHGLHMDAKPASAATRRTRKARA